jgi:hypothetical protein
MSSLRMPSIACIARPAAVAFGPPSSEDRRRGTIYQETP